MKSNIDDESSPTSYTLQERSDLVPPALIGPQKPGLAPTHHNALLIRYKGKFKNVEPQWSGPDITGVGGFCPGVSRTASDSQGSTSS